VPPDKVSADEVSTGRSVADEVSPDEVSPDEMTVHAQKKIKKYESQFFIV